ncbi:MAG: ABC transporter ATP-binding protein [Candidatus Margulisiibacteriota bacterium]|nr:MAG: hypothetical protein A2X42_10720 [Candidatus Margulisbacteria bacterium GWF2_38_17]OGI05716.1 MAG: hypothetical protein A2X41_03305 [Candidatus Margulisbacteria bacterium GWE2_39_32]PZM83651.1 MAG: ABC transporter ATP-binding protein [Candidatus Margulisiibacteriota bacterium]HCT85809.1 ABC transporter ATP-binding protein [Candidatus Margulisiibacteriota bacterium]HCY36027.1 ABC transporter ATP-binding protein [Candidatus Margulisiibacteriota bacterium]
MDAVVKVENLSKSYILSHQPGKRYVALRDVISEKTKKITGRILHPFLAFKELKPLHEEFWALNDVSFNIRQGDRVGIIGRNGAGKSTLLKILSRITEPTKGHISIKGSVASLLEVGTGFHPELTGRENIFLNGAILGMKRTEIKKKFDEIVAFAEIEKFLDTPVKRYSSGMYVRLAFAVAAHLEPEILVVDEVLAVGDSQFQKKCLGKMEDVSAKEGRTVLFVSHNMVALQSLCNKGLLLLNGRVAFDGASKDAIQKYLQEFNKKSVLDLSSRCDREGNQAVKITNIKFYNDLTGDRVDVLVSGMPVLIEVEYFCQNSKKVKSFDISISFWTQMQTFLFACRSSAVGVDFRLIEKGKIYCKIQKWPLNAGIYKYNIYTEANGIMSDRIVDVEDLNVESGDYYQTGKLPAAHLQGVFIDHQWLDGGQLI